MPKPAKPDIRFVVSTTEQNFSGERNLELDAQVVVVTPDGKVRNPSFGWFDGFGGGEYEGLKVTANLYKDSDWIFNQAPLVYGLYSVDERRAGSLARTLKRIQTKLDRFNDQLGATRDLPSYLARLAVACGATTTDCFGVSTRAGHTWDELGLRWMDANSLHMHLETIAGDWRKA